ncbi:MAG: hypothetical protein AAGK04_00040 [Planctomycetota bacterium]
MPPLPELRVSSLAELAAQLRFAPHLKLLDDIDRIERLAADVDPEANYPEEWIEFRVTGLRRDLPEPITVAGAALLADLSSLAERLCEQARLTEAELAARLSEQGRQPALHADALAERWNVSRKTVDRCRKRGLIGRRIRGANGKTRIVFTPESVRVYESSQRESLERAAEFSRIEPAIELRMLRRAERYHELFGCTLNQCAERLAKRYQRSLEAVRQILRRHDASGAAPIFDDPGSLTRLQRRALLRAEARGIDPATLARRYRRTRPTIARAIHLERARRLWAWRDAGALEAPRLATFDRDDAHDVLLGAPAVRAIGVAPAPSNVGALLALARSTPATPADDEQACVIALHFCRATASDLASDLDREQPEARTIDRAEAMLRLASQIWAWLVRAQMGLVLATIERRHERPSEAMRTDDWLGAWRSGVASAWPAIGSFDATRGGRLAAPVGLAVDRALAAASPDPTTRATPRLRTDEPIEDWRNAPPWSAALQPDRRLRPRPERDADAGRPPWWSDADADARRVLGWRFGYPVEGSREAPMTLEALAERLSTGRAHAPRRLRIALRTLLEAARLETSSAPGPE